MKVFESVEDQSPAIFKSITTTEKARQELRRVMANLFEAEANKYYSLLPIYLDCTLHRFVWKLNINSF